MCIDKNYFTVEGNVSWTDPYAEPKELQRFVLPTAPRSARARNIDISSIPKGPPYTAFLGNLPYDVDEDDIFHFFQSVQVIIFFMLRVYVFIFSKRNLPVPYKFTATILLSKFIIIS